MITRRTILETVVGDGAVVVAAVLCLAVVSAVSATESSVVIERCRLFDPESGLMLSERTIVIRGTQIVCVASNIFGRCSTMSFRRRSRRTQAIAAGSI